MWLKNNEIKRFNLNEFSEYIFVYSGSNNNLIPC